MLANLAAALAVQPPPPPTCPDGATAAPNATWGGACFLLTAQRTPALRQCVEWCGEQGMTPACIGSAEENAFVVELVPEDDGAFIGLYQNHAAYRGVPAEGWDRCVGGEASGFTNWDVSFGEPNDYGGSPQSCTVLTGQGTWWDVTCAVPLVLLESYRCLCEGPSWPSDSFQQDLEVLQDEAEAGMSKANARVAVVYPVCFLVAFIPAVFLLGRHWLLRGASSEGEGDAGGDEGSWRSLRVRALQRTRLHAARRSAAQRRLRVSGLMAQSGWAVMVFGAAPVIMQLSGNRISHVVGPEALWFIMAAPGPFLLLLALLPTDARAIRSVCALSFAICVGLGLLWAFAALGGNDAEVALLAPFSVLCLAAAVGLGPTLLCRGPRTMQPCQKLHRLWLLLRLNSLAVGMLFVGWASAVISDKPPLRREPLYIGLFPYGATLIVCALVSTPANRGRLHRRLGRLGGGGSEEEEAAAISALVAGAHPAVALANAAKMFRCLRASSLTEEDLAGAALGVSSSAAELAAKTEDAQLGEVTCFLSHSWRDEDAAPGQKFKVFASWAREHEQTTGREPTLWLDKACIDQTNIDQCLACLPVFLSGCEILLIVAGPTYCSRLWCVMEIFTFMRMGGAMDRVSLRLITSPDQNQAAAEKELTAQLATFNAAEAQCFKQEDRQRLLAVIEAGFGNFSDFNKGVRSMFELRREPSAASLQQVDGTSEAGGRSVELENVPVEVPRP